jgi:CMP-N-acetylneuraminic acid synthetase
MTHRVTALVPMKRLSERVPGKNLRPFHGRPLYHWVVNTLRLSRFVEEIVVNTDSEEIARGAEELGARILWRPDHLLGHMVGIMPLIEYDLSQTKGEHFLQTHSTNPLLTTETVDAAVAAFFLSGDHDSLFTVTPVQSRFYWPDGRPVNHDPNNLVRTQDLPPIYEENSCMYIFTRSGFMTHGHRVGSRPIMFPMSGEEAVDIDEPIDFAVAEALMAARLNNLLKESR